MHSCTSYTLVDGSPESGDQVRDHALYHGTSRGEKPFVLISMQPYWPEVPFPPGNWSVSRSMLPCSFSCQIPSLLGYSRLASVRANRQFPINIYIAFLFYFFTRLWGLGWLQKMFSHLNNIPVGGLIPALCWAVEKSGCGHLWVQEKLRHRSQSRNYRLGLVNVYSVRTVWLCVCPHARSWCKLISSIY